MSTLQEKNLQCNSAISVSNDGGQLSTDAGMVLVQEFLNKINFKQLLTKTVHLHDRRKYCTHDLYDLFIQLLLQIIAGYKADSAANTLRHDPVLTTLLEKEVLASQPTLSRFLQSLTEERIQEIQTCAQILGVRCLIHRNQQELVIDVDSTHCDTFGKQENTTNNAHYGTNGFHPLIAFDGLTGLFLGAQLRPGNVYTSTEVAAFVRPLIERYRHYSCEMTLLLRGDSGFATPQLYELCEETQTKFVIRLKASQTLKQLGEHQVLYGDETDFTCSEIQYYEIDYRAGSWQDDYRVIAKCTRAAGELFFRYEFLVTNLREIPMNAVYDIYQKRGTMENDIKEIKHGFFFDKTDSSSFRVNSARMMISCLAYNLIHTMKQLTFTKEQQKNTIATVRFKLFHLAGRVTKHARKTRIQLASTNVFDSLFWQVLSTIQCLRAP